MCTDALTLNALGTYMSGTGQVAVDRQNAASVTAAGYANEDLQRNDARQKMAQQVAALSNRGLSVSSGTPLALQADSARNAELNALQVRANAANTAAGYSLKASSEQQALPFTIAGQMLNQATDIAKLAAA